MEKSAIAKTVLAVVLMMVVLFASTVFRQYGDWLAANIGGWYLVLIPVCGVLLGAIIVTIGQSATAYDYLR